MHGGGREIDAALLQASIPKQQVDGLRITDDATLQVVVAVLAGTWALSILICAVSLLLPSGVPKTLQQSIGFPIVLLPLACLISVGVVAYKQLPSSVQQRRESGS